LVALEYRIAKLGFGSEAWANSARSDYIQIRSPVYISHSAGRYAVKRFRKAQCPVIERLTNSLMMNGRNNGKKLMAVRIVAHAFEIVRLPNAISGCQRQIWEERHGQD
jgi:hypothetical protein